MDSPRSNYHTLLLPDDVQNSSSTTPPRSRRPPSISYLYEQRDEVVSSEALPTAHPGLLLRKRGSRKTASGFEMGQRGGEDVGQTHAEEADTFGSSPILPQLRTPLSRTLSAGNSRRRFSNVSNIEDVDFVDLSTPGFDNTPSDLGIRMDSRATTPTMSVLGESPLAKRDLQRQMPRSTDKSSAALSRRAELILANAKKRLNVGDLSNIPT